MFYPNCPVCNQPRSDYEVIDTFDNNDNKYKLIIAKCPNCKNIICLASVDLDQKPIIIYPNDKKLILSIPDCIYDIAPKFCELFNQIIIAYNNNLNLLIEFSCRCALERLLSEYYSFYYKNNLINQNNLIRPESFDKKKLKYKIDYVSTNKILDLYKIFDTIRNEGNNGAHITKK